MNKTMGAAALAMLLATAPAPAQTTTQALDGKPIRIGVLNDMSGPYADLSGKGSVTAAQMAAEDFMAEQGANGLKVEVLGGDHQNKADVGATLARQWVDQENVAAVVDVPNSAVALAVNKVMLDKDRTFLASSSATSDLTGPQCAPTTVQWTFDTWALAHGTVGALVKAGSKTWFFIAADYAFGTALTRDATAVVQAGGGTVVGDVKAPLGTTDLSSFILQAQASGADVIATANSGDDASNTIKQAAEFGVGRDGRQKLAGLLIFLTDVRSMGLETAQGLLLTEAFYWDLNDKTRAWSQRFAARTGGRMPTMNHAGVYSETMAYLRAVVAEKTLSGRAVVARMIATPMDDPLFGPTTIRRDGRAVHAMFLFRVKKPADSKGPNDLYDVVATIPAAEAFRPMAEGKCPLVATN